MAQSTTATTAYRNYPLDSGDTKRGVVVTVVLEADAATGAFATASLTGLKGFVDFVRTTPGDTAPTDLFDVELQDSDSYDVLENKCHDMSNSAKMTRFPKVDGGTLPVFVDGDYTFAVTGNSENSADLTVEIGIVWLF